MGKGPTVPRIYRAWRKFKKQRREGDILFASLSVCAVLRENNAEGWLGQRGREIDRVFGGFSRAQKNRKRVMFLPKKSQRGLIKILRGKRGMLHGSCDGKWEGVSGLR